MKPILLRVVIGLVAALAVLYAVDWTVLQIRIRVARESAFSTVQVSQFISLGLKGNKQEYYYEGTISETCVRAIFPHASSPACWWLRRHTTQWDNAGAILPNPRGQHTKNVAPPGFHRG